VKIQRSSEGRKKKKNDAEEEGNDKMNGNAEKEEGIGSQPFPCKRDLFFIPFVLLFVVLVEASSQKCYRLNHLVVRWTCSTFDSRKLQTGRGTHPATYRQVIMRQLHHLPPSTTTLKPILTNIARL
jgi:hypothetical protein